MKKKKRLECEFSDKELDSWVQEFRRACQDDPDPNEEQFPSNAEDMHEHIVLLEHLVKKNPTQELKEDLRVYKALRSGVFIGHATATEWLMKRSDEIKSKRTIIITLIPIIAISAIVTIFKRMDLHISANSRRNRKNKLNTKS